jgi:hypothetical protein
MWVGMIGVSVLATLVPLDARSYAQSPSSSVDWKDAEIRAAFIYNFMKFIEWPADSARAGLSYWTIGVVRDSILERALAVQVAGKVVGGHPLRTRSVTGIRDILPSDALVVGASANGELGAIIAQLGSRPVLTVGQGERFCDMGGQIRIFHQEDRMRFEVNVDAIRRSGLVASSKLLSLAKIHREPRKKP